MKNKWGWCACELERQIIEKKTLDRGKGEKATLLKDIQMQETQEEKNRKKEKGRTEEVQGVTETTLDIDVGKDIRITH